MSKLYIETHGCQMNEYDSSRMGQLLSESHDLQMTDDPSEADVILLNTCSIREKAQEKVFHQLGRWKKLKHTRPDVIIGVGGCVASQEGSAILDRAPFVDVVFGPQTLQRERSQNPHTAGAGQIDQHSGGAHERKANVVKPEGRHRTEHDGDDQTVHDARRRLAIELALTLA